MSRSPAVHTTLELYNGGESREVNEEEPVLRFQQFKSPVQPDAQHL